MLDEERIAADEALDGYYCIITSEQEMDDREIIEAYRGLWRIEGSFRVLKGDMGPAPSTCRPKRTSGRISWPATSRCSSCA